MYSKPQRWMNIVNYVYILMSHYYSILVYVFNRIFEYAVKHNNFSIFYSRDVLQLISSTEILLLSCSSVLFYQSCSLAKSTAFPKLEILRIVTQFIVFLSRNLRSFDSSLVELSMTWPITGLLCLCLLQNSCGRLSKYICLAADLHFVRFSGLKWFLLALLHLFLTATAFSYFCADMAENGTLFSSGWYSIALTCTFLAFVAVSLPF